MIELTGLTKRFGRCTVVDDVSLSIAPGESVALWGPNGAGKTTIIRCILGLLRYRGSIRVGGIDARRDGKSARQLIGYVPQELSFYDDLRVGEAIRFFARLKGLGVADPDAALKGVGLSGHGRKRVRELSGGMKQRLALAIALLGDPPVLILDEVTASLDAAGRGEFVTLLSRLARTSGRATLFASHRAEEIEALATRVVTMQAGRTSADEPASAFVRRHHEGELLHVFLDSDRCAEAIDLLRSRGFSARANGRGIFVPIDAGAARITPLNALCDARIRVSDFEVLRRPREVDPRTGVDQ